jgi:DNA modification methylase
MTIEAVLSGAARYAVVCGDNIATLRTMPDACVDSVVCDPPYEISFMSKKWDASGVAYDVERWREVLRVLKPGGHLLAFGGTRTYHRMTCAIEDAGFEIRDSIHWVYGSGFPKSLDVSKAIDSAAGAEREVVGSGRWSGREGEPSSTDDWGLRNEKPRTETAPATEAAAEWQGWGTALKPAHEPIVVARKPLAGTVAANVQEYGTGALNIDACRVYTDWQEADRPESWKRSGNSREGYDGREVGVIGFKSKSDGIDCNPLGRWPSNFVLSHSPGCVRVGRKKVASSQFNGAPDHPNPGYQGGFNGARPACLHAPDGTETVEDWRCVDGCPVKMLGEQSGELTSGTRAEGVRTGIGYQSSAKGDGGPAIEGSTGTASRFFHQFAADPFIYEAKASRTEREAGCESLPAKDRGEITGRDSDAPGCKNPRSGKSASGAIRNTHPTVKPVALMRWCVRLVTPPGGVVLDPYAGSGSTGCGAVPHGFRFIGCELHAEHVAIANARIAWWVEHPGGPTAASKDEAALERAGQLPLLGGAG